MKHLLCLFCLLLALPVGAAIRATPYTTNQWMPAAVFQQPTILVFVGDSETSGKPSVGLTNAWPYWFTNVYVTNNIEPNLTTNLAVDGWLTTNSFTNFAAEVGFHASNVNTNGTNAFVFCWSGINDTWGNVPAHQILYNISNVWHIAQSNSMKVVAFTIPYTGTERTLQKYPPHYDGDLLVFFLGFDTNRTYLNSLIRTSTKWDYLVDAEQILDWPWTLDGAHFNHDAQRLLARHVAEVLMRSRKN